MKNSPPSSSSSSCTITRATIFCVFFLVAILFFGTWLAAEAVVHEPSSCGLCGRHFLHHRHHRHHAGSSFTSCSSLRPPSWCPSQTQPPPPFREEIDPRYGVEKRLVPTGPNPLHN